ncbi:MAG TPA: hypothetical protein VHU85_02475 [Acidimicrobiales bacterium]|jgi:hypothetical protein|nr:hypothetical protein [Acidimicrobiales bacterium]
MTDTDVPDDLGPTDDPGADDETTELPKTASPAAPLRVTKGTGHPGWMSRPVHRRFPIRRSTLLLVLLAAGFEFLHIQYPSAPKAPSAPAGYVPAFIPAVTTTTTTTTPPTTTLPVTTTTTTTLAPKASSTTSTLKVGSGSTTTTTTGVGGATSSTTTTLLPGLGGTTTTTSTFPS